MAKSKKNRSQTTKLQASRLPKHWLRWTLIVGGVLLAAGYYRWDRSQGEDLLSVTQGSQHRETEGSAPLDARGGKELQGQGGPRTPLVSETLEGEDLAKLQLIEELLTNRTFDTDPRVDRDLRELSPQLKEQLMESYRSLPRESLNQRGSVVFLLGRAANRKRDLAFLTEVAESPICGSLTNCSKKESVDPSHFDHDTGAEVTLRYPQLMALTQLRNQATSPDLPPGLRQNAREALLQAAGSASDPEVRKKARRLVETL